MSTLYFFFCYDSLVCLLAWGYHTVHCYSQGRHWGLYPAFHTHPLGHQASFLCPYLFAPALFCHADTFCPAGEGRELGPAWLCPSYRRAPSMDHMAPRFLQSIFLNSELLVKRGEVMFYHMDDFWPFQRSLFGTDFSKSFMWKRAGARNDLSHEAVCWGVANFLQIIYCIISFSKGERCLLNKPLVFLLFKDTNTSTF